MDFIEKLLSFSGFNTILVIVDWFTKQTIFIPAHNTIMSMDLACLFVLHMFSKHSVPSHIVSNRGLEFVSNFFCSLGTALDIWLHFTSDYHPKVIDKPSIQIRHWSNTSVYIVTISKTTSPNSYLLWILPIIIL